MNLVNTSWPWESPPHSAWMKDTGSTRTQLQRLSLKITIRTVSTRYQTCLPINYSLQLCVDPHNTHAQSINKIFARGPARSGRRMGSGIAGSFLTSLHKISQDIEHIEPECTVPGSKTKMDISQVYRDFKLGHIQRYFGSLGLSARIPSKKKSPKIHRPSVLKTRVTLRLNGLFPYHDRGGAVVVQRECRPGGPRHKKLSAEPNRALGPKKTQGSCQNCQTHVFWRKNMLQLGVCRL